MSIDRFPFGTTGLCLPKVVFGATVLGNLFVALSDQQKHDLIREWFDQMPKPIVIDSAGKYGAGLSLEVIGRELDALGVAPKDVVISNKLAWRRVPLTGPEPTFEPGVWMDLQYDAVQDISYDGILRCYADGCRMLGNYPPQLVAVHDPDEYIAAAAGPADRQARLHHVTEACRALTQLRRDGIVAGVGVGAKDWRCIQELTTHCDLDWVMMANTYTIMHHPPELLQFIDELASKNVAIINSAVTHGGFLTGGKFLDYREIDPNDPADAQRLKWRDSFAEVCQQHERSTYEVAVAFGALHPAFNAVALSTSSPHRVASMIQAATQELPSAIWDSLRERGLIDPELAFVG